VRKTSTPAAVPAIFAGRVKRYEFHLRITSEKFVDYYRGAMRHVVARSTDGQSVQFPASLLQRFLRPDGIEGRFVLTCDEHNKCLSLARVGDA
jgi:hypothetical protein